MSSSRRWKRIQTAPPTLGQELAMRFMVLGKATERSERGEMPSEKMLVEMGKYNETLAKAGGPVARDALVRVVSSKLAPVPLWEAVGVPSLHWSNRVMPVLVACSL